MKALFIVCVLVLSLVGCAHEPVPYDQQFSVLDTVDKDGIRRSHAWIIGPVPGKRSFEYDRHWPQLFQR